MGRLDQMMRATMRLMIPAIREQLAANPFLQEIRRRWR